jgi:hypothetical protein
MANEDEIPPWCNVSHQKAMCKDPSLIPINFPLKKNGHQPYHGNSSTLLTHILTTRGYGCIPPQNQTGGGTYETNGLTPSKKKKGL